MSAHATLYLLRKALAATPGDHESDTVRLTRGTVRRLVEDLGRLPAAVDLDADADPKFGMWFLGAGFNRYTRDVTAWAVPDDGDTVWVRRQGWPREELPGLIAWLSAVYARTGGDTAGGETP